MEYNQNNFTYLKTTNLEKYYDELVKAEQVYEYFPVVTRVVIRKVMEGILKDTAEKYNVESNVSAWNLIKNVKMNASISLPQEIYDYIEIILINGYEYVCLNKENKKYFMNPIELLQTMNNVLCWFLKKTESQKMLEIKDFSFKIPSSIKELEKEISKINTEILLKDNQINNLRQRILELSSQSKSISELNKITMAIKEEKVHLESEQVALNKKIRMQKIQITNVENNYEYYTKIIDKLQQKYNENERILFERESQFVKIEIQNQELANLYKELDEKDESIIRMQEVFNEELKIVRQTYEYLTKSIKQHQDILETMEFSYDKQLQKELEIKKNTIEMEISFQDRVFNENISNYDKDLPEIKRKILISKELLNEQIKREIMYDSFYRGFLKLKSKELRIIYTIITNTISSSSSLIDRSKELFLKSSDDRFLESVNKNFEELKNVSDDEIKLLLYYKLVKLSQVPLGPIYNRRRFVRALDNMVNRAYEILMVKKEFKGGVKKLDSIISYYLEKVIMDLKNKYNKLQLNDELTDKIYRMITILKQDLENIHKPKVYYDKFDIDNMPEGLLRMSIKSQPFIFLSIMVDLGGIDSYKRISSIIYGVKNFIDKKNSVKENNERALSVSFSNEYFLILIFLSSGVLSLKQKYQDELLPLLIMEIVSIDLLDDKEEINLENYNSMVDLWKRKQQKYNDIYMEKEEKESILSELMKEKYRLENSYQELSRTNGALSHKYNDYNDEFKKIVLNSEKRIHLSSFENYEDLRNKKEAAEEHINESKNKMGTLKSILSPEVWKDQASKLINESNMLEAEKALIEEAKQKSHFKEEYAVFKDLKSKIDTTNKMIKQEEEELKNKDLMINNIKVKVNELQKQINIMKEAYLDMKEGYY